MCLAKRPRTVRLGWTLLVGPQVPAEQVWLAELEQDGSNEGIFGREEGGWRGYFVRVGG